MLEKHKKIYDIVISLRNNNFLVAKKCFDKNGELCEKYFIIYDDETIIEIGDINLVDLTSEELVDFYWDSNYIYKCLRSVNSKDLSIDEVYDIKRRCFLPQQEIEKDYT